MQGRPRVQGELLDVESLAGHLLPLGSVFAFLAEHRHRLFPVALFEDLFKSGLGRPSVPPDVIAAVIVLQTLHGLSDREAADAVTFDLRWKAACGIAVDAGSFHPSTLTYWRRRLASSKRPQRIFEVVRQVIVETGAVAGKTRRALDSTVLDDAVARQDTVTQLIAAIRRTARDVDGAAGLVQAVCTGHDYAQPGKPRIAWDDPAARDELVSALVNDALALLDALNVAVIEKEGGKAAEAVALLALVAGQDVEPADGSDGSDGRWRIARTVAHDRVISTVDQETRHAHKTRHRNQDGFKAHIVIEPDTGLVTAAKLTKATGVDTGDAAVGIDLLTDDSTIDKPGEADTAEADRVVADEPAWEVLGDSAYGTGPMLAALDKAGYRPVVKPRPLRAAVDGGFTLDDFVFDANANTLTCPNGITRTLTTKRNAIFGVACLGCPLRDRCTTSNTGRTVKLTEHEALQRSHRARASGDDFQTVYRRHRPMVERTIAWLTRGNRRVPYRGVTKNNAWICHRVAAINLRRLITLGLTATENGWALIPA